MSDLLEDAEALLAQLPEAVERRRLGQRLNQAVTALREAERHVERMTALVDLSTLVEFGTTSEQQTLLTDMVETAADVGRDLETAHDEDTLRRAVHDYENTLPPTIRALDQGIRERWRGVVSERFQPMIGIGQLLDSMNVRDNLGGRLAECGRKAQAATNPSAAADFLIQVRALLDEYEVLQAERSREIVDDEVGDFINALAERRATLSMVTPKVHGWLEQHDALDRLRINPR